MVKNSQFYVDLSSMNQSPKIAELMPKLKALFAVCKENGKVEQFKGTFTMLKVKLRNHADLVKFAKENNLE